MEFIPFPSINQYRNFVHDFPETRTSFRGTVKLHGTNAGIQRTADGQYVAQSRNNLLINSDNAGFAAYVRSLPKERLDNLFSEFVPGVPAVVFGEWAGKGVMGGTAISQIDKFFYIFATFQNDVWSLPSKKFSEFSDLRIFNAVDFQVFDVEIDTVDAHKFTPELVASTQKVEECCPVGKAMGVEGIGEGIVYFSAEKQAFFKVKGDKHSSSNVTVLAAADVEKIDSIKEFATRVTPVGRLEQGLAAICPDGKLDKSKCKDFISWVIADILKEDKDAMDANGFTMKELGAPVGKISSTFFIGRCSNP